MSLKSELDSFRAEFMAGIGSAIVTTHKNSMAPVEVPLKTAG